MFIERKHNIIAIVNCVALLKASCLAPRTRIRRFTGGSLCLVCRSRGFSLKGCTGIIIWLCFSHILDLCWLSHTLDPCWPSHWTWYISELLRVFTQLLMLQTTEGVGWPLIASHDFSIDYRISLKKTLLNHRKPLIGFKDLKSAWMLYQLRESSFVLQGWRTRGCKMVDRTKKFSHGCMEPIVRILPNFISSQDIIEHKFHRLECTNYDGYVILAKFIAFNTLH
jgi:hypothetical protein